jgi:hypothetical protein
MDRDDITGNYVGSLPRSMPMSSDWQMCVERVMPHNDVTVEVLDPARPEVVPFQVASHRKPKWVRMRPVYNAWRKLTARIKWLTGEPYTEDAVIVNVLIAWLTDVIA